MPKRKRDEEKTDPSGRQYGYCLTLYNLKDFPDFSALDCDYTIAGNEICPKTKKQHYQCYVHRRKRISFKAIKNVFPTAHIEEAKGNGVANQKYCSKDGDFKETGTLPRQGSRNDIEAVYKMAADQCDDIEIGETHPGSYLRYYRGIDRVRNNYARRNFTFEKIEVIVFYGPAGSGKTRKAHEIDPALYRVDSNRGNPWFNGYSFQETILFDDYYGEIPLGKFLQFLDGYKFDVPTKGGFVWKQWKRVIITSNDSPEKWYNYLPESLARRLTKIEKVLPQIIRQDPVEV